MKQVIFGIIILAVCGVANVYAANTSANHGHHGGGNNGALGAAAHGSSSSSQGASQSGNGGMGDCDVTHYSICAK
jgi:hypothetical protein